MEVKFSLILIAISSALAEFCEDSLCEHYPEYPLEKLQELDLWKYRFPNLSQVRHKRMLKDANQYLIETKLCDSKISFYQPRRLTSMDGMPKTIVNHSNFTQLIRAEECTSANFPCTWDLYPKSVKSFCHQTYIKLNLWTFDDANNCLVMDKFKVPSSCDCIIEKEDFLKGVNQDLLQRP